MADYKLAPHGGVVRAADGAVIPEDTTNTDWIAYLAWVTGGGVVDPADLSALDLAKQQATRRVEVKAQEEALGVLGTPAAQAEFRGAEFEALHKKLDPAVLDADIPLLVARIDATYVDTAATAGDVMATSKTNRESIDTIHTDRVADLATIASAVLVSECEAVAPLTNYQGVPL